MAKERKQKAKGSKKVAQPKPKEREEEQGFPKDVDFKRFLGCGG